jgi:hypothetical protein
MRKWRGSRCEIDANSFGFATAHSAYANDETAKVVSPEGLEPPTSDLEGRCSIQLSYGLPKSMILK